MSFDLKNMLHKKKKIVIMSGATGGGHVKAAVSLKKYAEQDFPDYEVIHLDVIEHMSKIFKKMYADAYINIINNFPKLFGYLYDTTDHSQDNKNKYILYKSRYFFEEFFALRFKRIISKIDPEYIIFTHFLPAEHLNKTALKKKYAGKYAVVVTDFDVHWLWVQKHMDMFFVATEEAAARLVSRGIDKNNVHVTGIPIEPEFSQNYDKRLLRERLKFDPDKKTILLMSGAYGVGKVDSFIEEIFSNSEKEFQLIALTGKNKKLYKDVEKIAKKYPGKIRPIKFTDQVYKFMAASDFAITKTGGLTTSECLAMGLPIVTINPIPGQEERNTNFLLEHGAALKALDNLGLLNRVYKLLDDDELLKNMQANAKKTAKPFAAYNILNTLINGSLK